MGDLPRLPVRSTHDTNKRRDNDMALFEGYERRIDKITAVLGQYGIGSLVLAATKPPSIWAL